MPNDLLTSILARHEANLEEEKRRELEEAEKIRLDEEQREKAHNDAETAAVAIPIVVSDLNKEMKGSELSLEFEKTTKSLSGGTIAQFMVHLLNKGSRNGRYLVLNFDTYGTVRPVALIPHTGTSPPTFTAAQANGDLKVYEGAIVAFLDQAIKKN